MTTRPVVTSVSQATRPIGSSFITASRMASEIWSAILSGWPSVTDSEVNRIFSSARVKTLSFGYLAGKLVAQAPDVAGNTNKNSNMRPQRCQRIALKRVIRGSNGKYWGAKYDGAGPSVRGEYRQNAR